MESSRFRRWIWSASAKPWIQCVEGRRRSWILYVARLSAWITSGTWWWNDRRTARNLPRAGHALDRGGVCESGRAGRVARTRLPKWGRWRIPLRQHWGGYGAARFGAAQGSGGGGRVLPQR